MFEAMATLDGDGMESRYCGDGNLVPFHHGRGVTAYNLPSYNILHPTRSAHYEIPITVLSGPEPPIQRVHHHVISATKALISRDHHFQQSTMSLPSSRPFAPASPNLSIHP